MDPKFHRDEIACEIVEKGSSHFVQIDGWVLDYYGVARGYASGQWAVIHLPTGLAVTTRIAKFRTALAYCRGMETHFPTASAEVLRTEKSKILRLKTETEERVGW